MDGSILRNCSTKAVYSFLKKGSLAKYIKIFLRAKASIKVDTYQKRHHIRLSVPQILTPPVNESDTCITYSKFIRENILREENVNKEHLFTIFKDYYNKSN